MKTRNRSALSGIVALLTLSCTNVVDVSSIPPDPISPGTHGFSPDFLSVCQQLGWTSSCTDPVYTDDQRFRLGPSAFGAHAYIAPSPQLGTWHRMADFATPRLVAIVWTKPEATAAVSATAWVNRGLSCIYLLSQVTGFVAYAEPAAAACPESYTPNPARALAVLPIANPGHFGEGTEMDQSRRVPAVARFHEGQQQAGTDLPLLGVKCAGRWCLLFPPNTPATERPPAHAGKRQDHHTWAIRGWSDSQRLALGAAPNLTPSGLLASIVADSALPNRDWAPVTTSPADFRPGEAQHAATIVLESRPVGIYDTRWHLKRGDNELFLWKDAAGRWYGEIQNRGFLNSLNRIKVYVEKRHAGTNPPATARFRWDPDDEEIWVACDGGCCYVSAFQ